MCHYTADKVLCGAEWHSLCDVSDKEIRIAVKTVIEQYRLL
jgi:hypothetical protein